MSNVNKVILLGRLGQEPTRNGPAVKFSVATTEKWKGNDGQPAERTEWSNVVVFGKLAEICEKYLRKGSTAYIEGRLQTDSYEKDGVKRYSTSIIANNVQCVGGGSQANDQGQNDPPGADSSEDIPF